MNTENVKWNGKKLQDFLLKEGFVVSLLEAKRVLTISKRTNKRAEDDCNGLTDTKSQRYAERDSAYIQELVKESKLPSIKFDGDPRGFCFRLMLPSGKHNTLGGVESGFGI